MNVYYQLTTVANMLLVQIDLAALNAIVMVAIAEMAIIVKVRDIFNYLGCLKKFCFM